MANVDAVKDALLEWITGRDPDATCALLLKTDEIALLHLSLEIFQDMMEKDQGSPQEMIILGKLRKKVEGVLIQGGYGGTGRP